MIYSKKIGDRKGIATLSLIQIICYSLVVAIVMGVFVFTFGWVDFALDRDIDLGQVNLGELHNDTTGKIISGFQDKADDIGIIIIFAMIILMLVNAYFTGDRYPVLFIVIDIFLIIFAFILAIYVAQVYQVLSTASSTLDVFINDIPNTSKFVLGLPFIVPVVGGLIIILSYAKLKKDRGEEMNVLEY